MGTVKQDSRKRVNVPIDDALMRRLEAERRRIVEATGIRPSLTGIVAAAIDRGLPPT